MDPDCAICHAPATHQCDCEAKGLDLAVKQAETRMMTSIYNDIRQWVRAHAQDYILEYFRLLTERRKAAHTAHLDRLSAHSFYHYNQPPHPNQIAEAQNALKRGIDEDWQASVQRYPEVLEYFFSLVELTLPSDDDAVVRDPPLSALNGSRKAMRRAGGSGGSAGSPGGSGAGPGAPPPPAALPQPQMDPRDPFGGMTRRPSPPQPVMSVPPPGPPNGMERMSARTPGPPGDRSHGGNPRRVQYRHHAPPPPPTSYYGAYS